jgi:DNA-binding NarL/FixJ family response regulator
MPFVLVVEDHPLIAESLVICIKEGHPNLLVEATHSLRAAGSRLENRPTPILIVTDLTLVDANGIDAVRALRAAAPRTPLLVFTAIDDPALRDLAIDLGVAGYLLKSTATATLCAEMSRLIGKHSSAVHSTTSAGSSAEIVIRELTKKQTEILIELVAGRSNKEIATRLGISDQTVSSHMKEVLSRLGVRNRTQAVSRYYQLRSQTHRRRAADQKKE